MTLKNNDGTRLADLFRKVAGFSPEDVSPLSGAGSNRRYYRLRGGDMSFIGVIGTDAEENRAFCTLAGHFRDKGIPVPAVLCASEDGMSYLQEDLGDISLYDAVASGRKSVSGCPGAGRTSDVPSGEAAGGGYGAEERALLCRAVAMLPKIQFEGARGLDFGICYPEPEFNGRTVMFDLNYFKYCFLKLSGLEFNETMLEDNFERFRDDLLCRMDDTFMYRDFQARNIMVRDGELYFIDFQGGRKGPAYYDLASFIWQASARYPSDLKEELVAAYMDALREYRKVDREDFYRGLRLFSLFRTLQVLGAYGFRGYIEKKKYFMDSVPYAIANLRQMLQEPFADYPYLDSLLRRLCEKVSDGCSCVASDGNPVLEVEIYSFSFKKGIPEDSSGNGGGYVFDCRSLNNPGRYEQYRKSTGRDEDVIRFFAGDRQMEEYLEKMYWTVDQHIDRFLSRGFTHLMASCGCTGGQHRSVYCAEHLAAHIRDKYFCARSSGAGSPADATGRIRIRLVHREQGIEEEIV